MCNIANWIAFYTLFRKEMMRVFRIWTQTLLPAIVTMGLYFIIFGNIIGSRVGNMEGVSYMQYIMPGLVMMAIINNSYANVSSSFFVAKFQRSIEEMLVSSMPVTAILSGYVISGIMRGLIVGLLVTSMALFFVDFTIYSWLITFIIALLTAALFANAGFINGIYAQKFDGIAFVPMFVLTPLTYLGGVFYSVDLLPIFWRAVTHFNPIYYMVSGFRYGMMGVSDVGILYCLAILGGCVLFSYLCAWWLLYKGVGLKS